MWKKVSQDQWPKWAASVTSVWQHPAGHFMLGTSNEDSTLWSLRSADGIELHNQLGFRFQEGLDGPPIAWADDELYRRRLRGNT